ncbi:hypothetical protein KYC5002_07985 [Archangium violaceum]|uniref:hypothetical protein n=1 Tax=Archangium violaceum TaxID=83451 RepID=UPI002B287A63|nr:hypothetical protein KYC5002_07985 [Archangium gephyra]
MSIKACERARKGSRGGSFETVNPTVRMRSSASPTERGRVEAEASGPRAAGGGARCRSNSTTAVWRPSGLS